MPFAEQNSFKYKPRYNSPENLDKPFTIGYNKIISNKRKGVTIMSQTKQMVLKVHNKPTKQNPNSRELEFQAEGLILPEIIQLALAEIEIASRKTMERAPTKADRQVIAEDIFEMINMGASTLLNKLFPEISLRPDVTEDAILDAENKRLADDREMKKYVDAYSESAQARIDAKEAPIKEKSVTDLSIAVLEQGLPIKPANTVSMKKAAPKKK